MCVFTREPLHHLVLSRPTKSKHQVLHAEKVRQGLSNHTTCPQGLKETIFGQKAPSIGYIYREKLLNTAVFLETWCRTVRQRGSYIETAVLAHPLSLVLVPPWLDSEPSIFIVD